MTGRTVYQMYQAGANFDIVREMFDSLAAWRALCARITSPCSDYEAAEASGCSIRTTVLCARARPRYGALTSRQAREDKASPLRRLQRRCKRDSGNRIPECARASINQDKRKLVYTRLPPVHDGIKKKTRIMRKPNRIASG